MKALIEDIARQLVVLNASWLSEIRTVGYRIQTESGIAITDQLNEIGITDRSGNSGYIRYASDQNFTRQDARSFFSCEPTSLYTFKQRLVVVAKTDTPEDLALLLSTQLNSLQITFSGFTSIKARATGGGSNSAAITKQEGGEQINSTYRVVYVDFDLSYQFIKDCDQIPIIMTCDNCTTTLDLGCIQHCESLTISAEIEYTGTATLNTHFNGIVISQSFEVSEGSEHEIPMGGLNENYEYSIQLRDADGEVISIIYGEDTYDCFKITLLP